MKQNRDEFLRAGEKPALLCYDMERTTLGDVK